jgi:hypothetical protein
MRAIIFLLLVVDLLSSTSCSSPKVTPPDGAAKAAPDSIGAATVPQEPDQELIPPETVRAEEMRIVSGVKLLTVGNTQGHYHLSCNAKVDSCVTPMPGADYLLFSKETRWKMPLAKGCCATLQFFQDYSISYKDQENVALVPSNGPGFGIYILESWSKTK